MYWQNSSELRPTELTGRQSRIKSFSKRDRFAHQVAQFFFEFRRPDIRILLDQIHDQVAEHLDVVRLVAQCVAKHLADTRELVLTVERKHHAEQAVELSAFHALTEQEQVLSEGLLVLGGGQIHVATQSRGSCDHEVGLALDGRDIFEHRLTLVRVDAERADHIDQGVGVDVFLVRMAAEQEA